MSCGICCFQSLKMASFDVFSSYKAPHFEKQILMASDHRVLRAGGNNERGFGIPEEIVVPIQPPSEADSEYFGYPTCIKNNTRHFKRDGRSLNPDAIKIIVPRNKERFKNKGLFGINDTPRDEENIRISRDSQDTDDDLSSTSESDLGDITFSLSYTPNDGILTVGIVQARDIPVRDFSGTADSYVELFLTSNPEEKHQTRVMRANKYPKFNENFCFPVHLSSDVSLRLLVVDFDMFSRHQVIGEVKTSLKDFDFQEGKTVTLVQPITPTTTAVFRGDILCCLTLQASEINVCIIKARNLKPGDLFKPIDSLVKVSLYDGDTKLKTKKTSTITNTRDPVYNESAMFDVSGKDHDNLLLRVTVFDYSNKQHMEIIGVADIGSKAPSNGANHWNEMVNNPGSTFSCWHQLMNALD